MHIGKDDLPDAEWDWLKMWTLNAVAGLLCYSCARTAAKVKIQVLFPFLKNGFTVAGLSWVNWGQHFGSIP